MIRVALRKWLNFNSIPLLARVGMGLGGHPAATTASDATPRGRGAGLASD
jgi:hypothetical protein